MRHGEDILQRNASRTESPPALEAIGVIARYPSLSGAKDTREPLSFASLSLLPGEMTVVIGPNGAGKSTLVRVLTGTLPPASGSVRLFGKDLAELGRRDIARRLSVVEQTSRLAVEFRAWDVVMMGRAPHQGSLKLPSQQDHDIVGEALARAGIEHLASRPVHALSGGEQGLVAFARALAQRADVLILDEASAHLDVHHSVALYELALREVRERNVACLAVVHDLNVAAAFAHRVVLMKEGRIEASGSVEEVMTYERLRKTFGVDLYAGYNELDDVRYFVPRRYA